MQNALPAWRQASVFELTESNRKRYLLYTKVVMQSIRKLRSLLETLANKDHCLFSVRDFAPVFPELSPSALKVMLGRATRNGLLTKICRGIYLYDKADYQRGLLLYRVAALMRSHALVYISLETALSDAGVISQIPINWISVMTSGRSLILSCGEWGTIEFVHTKKKAESLAELLSYDSRCGLWRASVQLALQDMRACGRPMDLIDWSAANEFV